MLDPNRRRPARLAVVGRASTVAAVLLISMGAGGAPGPRIAATDAGGAPAGRAGPLAAPAAKTAGAAAGGAAAAGDTGMAAATTAFNPSNAALSLQLVASGFDRPVLVTNAGDGSNRLFVVEQTGRIWIVDGGTKLATPFLDLHTAVSTGSEQGLLGLAFHPSYPALPYFYVYFTDRGGTTIVNRYRVSTTDPNVADRASGVRILTIAQPYANHNGGNLAFGPGGYLYIGMGDGGSAGDPGNRAQNLNSLLGKMLRIDINHGSGSRHYRSPATNPYVGRTGLDEIWARGLRNPWRWSIDPVTGALWIGDVGQGRYEEVDRSLMTGGQQAGRGANYGWPVLEGRVCYRPSSGCSTSGKTMPLAAYTHTSESVDNCSITGGFVYRGSADPVLRGDYVYGDFCSGRIWVLSASAAAPARGTLVWGATASPHLMISSFGQDESGELYVADLGGGRVYRIRATAKG